MNTIKIIETGNYKELIPLFRVSGLEINQEDAHGDLITCWKATGDDETPVGGVSIENRKGYFVVGDIAVQREFRNTGVATMMMETAMKKLRELGAEEIYLVAKAPKFFEKLGFKYITSEEIPDIFTCQECQQRGVKCFPEFMKFDYK